MLHHLIVKLNRGTNVCTILMIFRKVDLELCSHMMLRNKGVFRLLHVPCLVGVTHGCVLMAPSVVNLSFYK